jgi:hypothetical protein
MTSAIFLPLNEYLDIEHWPFGGFVSDAAKYIYLTPPTVDELTQDTLIGLSAPVDLSVEIPGLDFLRLGLGAADGSLLGVRVHPSPFNVGLHAVVALRVRSDVLCPLKPGTNERDTETEWFVIPLGAADVRITSDGHLTFETSAGITVPRCMVGSSGVILEIGKLRWLTPQTDLTTFPGLANLVPPGFTGVYLENVGVEITGLPIEPGKLALKYAFIGTGGFTGEIDWSAAPPLVWTGTDFEHGLHGEVFGFKGGLSKVRIVFKQSTFTECEIEGNVFVPYLDRVIGLSIGFDGNGGLTAIAQTPTCDFANAAAAAKQGPAGYIFTADTDAFILDVSRIEFHVGRSTPASLAVSGRAKLKISAFELPGVIFKGLRIDTEGHVAVEGGWLDVDTAKSSALSGFPFQITKIGFGAESKDVRWVGLNGGIKLADGLPMGASVEGLRVVWNTNTGKVSFALEGIGLELSVPGTFSFAGQVAFFDNEEATGFRGTLKLNLETVKLSIDAGLMIGRTKDGVTFFFFFLDVGLPVGIPLFSTGAAIYGFAGLLATNLKPARAEGESWYYGYYKRPPVGVTDPKKWGIQRDAFAIGLGTTLGSLPDTGFCFSAKILLILVLPGPQLLLQGKGQFISKKPDEKKAEAEGTFEALLVLDIPAKLFQANLAVAFKIADMVEVSAGVDVAFSWSKTPPTDIWHVYLGEKTPAARRIHATLFKLLKGDSWLMINRTHQWPPGLPDREGDFEIGGSIGVNFNYDFSIAKAWLDASMMGQAAVTWDPQQFNASLTLKGSAGVMALGLSIVVGLLADARVKAPSPWHISIFVEVGIKIDLLLGKWEFHARLPLEFGDEKQPLPEPLTHFVTLHTDHPKVDEAKRLASAVVAPDARPLIIFDRPVQDRVRFGSPGRDDVEHEDLGLRQFSYRLRHVVLITTTQGAPRLVAAAGEVTLSGANASFGGLIEQEDQLPDLTGAELTLLKPGQTSGPFTVISGSGNSATIAGNPPQGEFSYRLSAVRSRANVQITAVSTRTFGDAIVSIAGVLANPSQYRGGNLLVGSVSWLILEATSASLRIRADSMIPSAGAASLEGPHPPSLEGMWYPAGDPVTGPDSSTRLEIGARTPYSFFRHNEQTAIAGLDAFRPDYACGPVAVEEALCSTFDDLATGPLTGAFTTVGLAAAAGGIVAVIGAGSGSAKRLDLGDFARHGGWGSLVFNFDPPADAVWVTAEAREAGWITATREGAVLSKVQIAGDSTRHEFNGGVDRIEIDGCLARVHKLCFTPGWTCVHFESASFPHGKTGRVDYAGLTLRSEGVMAVDLDTLEVEPPDVTPSRNRAIDVRSPVTRIVAGGSPLVDEGPSLATTVLAGGPPEVEGIQEPSVTIVLVGLVEAAVMNIPGLGAVNLIPGLAEIPTPYGPAESRPRAFPVRVTGSEPWRDRLNMPGREILVDTGRVWVQGTKAKLATVTIEFPKPVTRVRVHLGSGAAVIAFANQREVCRSNGVSGSVVSLYADPAAPSHIGWMDRVVIMGPSQARVLGICNDAGDFGQKRFEQWKWSQGVQRSVESLYRPDPVLSPGTYELRVHTETVVTGAEPREIMERTSDTFTVGPPPGFPVDASPGVMPGMPGMPGTYPSGGPLTALATYIEGTMPPAGSKLWYRSYDTAVRFNESYVTRLYLESDNELKVSVVNASQVPIRSGVRHVWSGSDAALDAWTDLYIRTLNGDGTNPCATVDVDKIVRPEQVTVGSGEPLEPAALHASELRTSGQDPRVLHRFEFTTSAYATFRHHLAVFDGRCRQIMTDPSAVASALSPRERAAARSTQIAKVIEAVASARAAKTAATGNAPAEALDAAKAAKLALIKLREETRGLAANDFEQIWAACFGAMPPDTLPSNVRLSIIEAVTQAAGTDVLLLESPEPIAWERVNVTAVRASATPQRKVATSLNSQFGRPDKDSDVLFGGIRWLAGVELWVVDGTLRARANEPISVTILPDQASAVEIVVRVKAGGSATMVTLPPLPSGPVVRGPSTSSITVSLSAVPGTLISSVVVTGAGVEIESCSATIPFIPIPPSGPIRIADIKLPTVTLPLDHEVTLLALEDASTAGYNVRWFDALTPGPTQLYATLATLDLKAGQRIRLVPARASAPPVDDEMVQAGGAGTSPPGTGAVFQLIDPAGRVVQECAAMPTVTPGTASLVTLPNHDGTRAFLVAPPSAPAIGPGYWIVTANLVGDAGPDLDRWSIANRAVLENASLRFLIRQM